MVSKPTGSSSLSVSAWLYGDIWHSQSVPMLPGLLCNGDNIRWPKKIGLQGHATESKHGRQFRVEAAASPIVRVAAPGQGKSMVRVFNGFTRLLIYH